MGPVYNNENEETLAEPSFIVCEFSLLLKTQDKN